MGYIEVICPYCQKKYRLTDRGLKILLGEIDRLKELVKNGESITGGQR